MKQSVNQAEIARVSGVSRTAVSFALNSRLRSRLRRETREQILAVAQRLGYQPNRAALALRTGRFHAVGLVIPDVANMYFAEMIQIFEQLLEARGYDLVLEDTHASLEREKFCLEKMLARQVDGIICFLADVFSHDEFFMRQWNARKPVVFIGSERSDLPVDAVDIDFAKGMARATDHLVDLGHRRIAFLCGLAAKQSDVGRVRLFKEGLERHGLPVGENSLIRCGHRMEDGFKAFGDYLRQIPSQNWPTAVMALNDIMAIGVMRAAGERDLRIPADLSVIGVDNTPLAAYLPIPLTSVSQPCRETAQQAVDYFLERLESKSWPPPRQKVFETDLVIRQSTGRSKW
ncbi:MAG: LacI family DNA-binding transcriptional regulator [Verrucomicrobia bacterium]|nr:LacI family DNA-binding transcriptional regulator [Verrucomicrobiota bacterium]